MCMNETFFSMKKTKNGYVGTGYKVLYEDDKKDHFNVSFNGTKLVKKGQWVEDKAPGSLVDNRGGTYPKGFHIWTTLEDAKRYGGAQNVYKVEFMNIVAVGTNNTGGSHYKTCIIARKMKIVSKVS